jgi:hypothetical protein
MREKYLTGGHEHPAPGDRGEPYNTRSKGEDFKVKVKKAVYFLFMPSYPQMSFFGPKRGKVT